MRVGFVIGQLHRGGSERQLFELARRLVGGRCEPFVYCLSQEVEPFGPRLAAAGVPLRVLPRHRSYEFRRIRGLARMLREDRIDLVHSLSLHANFYALLAILLAGRRPFLTSNRVVDQGCGRFEAWVNGFVFRRSRRVIVNSRAGREFTSRFFRVRPEQIEIVLNGVDLEPFRHPIDAAAARASLGWPAAAPVAALVGRVDAQKRVDRFLEVARRVSRRLPEARFVVIGDGPLLTGLRRTARESGLDPQVLFAGPRDDVPQVMAAMDLLVLTSAFEGLPNAVLEAMAAGRPVVATDVGGCRELIVDGVTGYLAPPDDVDGLAEKTHRILSSGDRGRSLGEAGRRRAFSEFGADAMARRFEELYVKLHRDPPEPV